jgi:hypothetical protein
MRVKLLSVLMLIGLTGSVALAQERQPAKLLAPYINESTFAAVEIDVKALDVDAIFGALTKVELPPGARRELAKEQAQAQQLRDAFLGAGGQFIYFVVNLPEHLPPIPEPLVVIPAEKAATRTAVVALLAQFPFLATEVKGDLIVAGSKQTLQALARRPAKEVPQFAQAFAAVAQYPQRAAFVLPNPLKRSLEELTPDLPKPLGGGSIKTLTRSVLSASLGLDLSEKLQVRVVVQAENAQAARELERLSGRALEVGVKEVKLPAQLIEILRPKLMGDRLELALSAKTLEATLLPLVARMRGSAARAQSINNLKQIGLAMHMYHDAHKSFPAQASYDKAKKPLLSWRVHILPYVDQGELYKQFKIDEPWDSAHNKVLLAKMPPTYRSPLMRPDVEAGKTTYLVPVGPKLIFNGPKATHIRNITDGTSNTIFAIDADDAEAVYWTQPEDWHVDPKRPKAGAVRDVGGTKIILAVFADGSVRMLPASIGNEAFWSLLTPSGGEAIQTIERVEFAP